MGFSGGARKKVWFFPAVDEKNHRKIRDASGPKLAAEPVWAIPAGIVAWLLDRPTQRGTR